MKALTQRLCGLCSNTEWTRRDLLTTLIVIIISLMILGTIIINGVYGVTNRPQITTAVVTIGDIRFSIINSGQGQDILLLHGFPEGHHAFHELVPLLNTEFKLTIPEMRGYNMSQKPSNVENYHIDKLVADVNNIVDFLLTRNGNRKIILMGHDFGGMIAYVVANKYPSKLKGLITVNAPHPNVLQYLWKNSEAQKIANQFIVEALKVNTTDDAIEFFTSMTRDVYFAKNRNIYLKAWNQPEAANSTIAWFKANFIGHDLKNIRTTFPCCLTIEVPTCILWGSKDPYYLYKENTDLIPSYLGNAFTMIKEFPVNGHWILHENPRDVADAVKQFIRKL